MYVIIDAELVSEVSFKANNWLIKVLAFRSRLYIQGYTLYNIIKYILNMKNHNFATNDCHGKKSL